MYFCVYVYTHAYMYVYMHEQQGMIYNRALKNNTIQQ